MKYAIRMAGAFLLIIVSSAPQAETIEEALQACRSERNDLKRLACFDKVSESIGVYADAKQSVDEIADARPQQQAEAQAEKKKEFTEEDFGIEMKRLSSDNLQASLTASVVDVDKSPRGDFILTLDNDMVWRQKGDSANYIIRKGDTVSIERGMFGAFYLSKEGYNGRVNVRRIK